MRWSEGFWMTYIVQCVPLLDLHSSESSSASSRLNHFFSIMYPDIVPGFMFLVTNAILFCCLLTIRDQCKKLSFYTHAIKVCVSCLWRCPMTSTSSALHLSVILFLCSSRSNAWAKLGPMEFATSAQKFIYSLRPRWGSCWEESMRTISSPMLGCWFALQANRWFYLQKEDRIELR